MSDYDMNVEDMIFLGQMATEEYEKNLPDIDEWIRTLEGCIELYKKGVEHLKSDPPNFEEATRAIGVSVLTGHDLQKQTALALIMSGQVVDELLGNIRKQFEIKEENE